MYKWTLPVVGEETSRDFQFAYLALPTRFITEEEYQRMVKMIELLGSALILERCQAQQVKRVTQSPWKGLPVFWNFARGE